MNKIFDKFFFIIFGVFVALDLLSFIAYGNEIIGKILFALIFVAIITLTIRKTEYGLYALIGELTVGGLGYLFFWPMDNSRISIRLALFVAVFTVWLIKLLIKKDFSWLKNKLFISTLILGLIVLIGVAYALIAKRPMKGIFSDVNAYLYFVLVVAFINTKIDWKKILQIILAGTTELALKSLVILFIFGHNLSQVGHFPIYGWIRDTGVGEITKIALPLYRIFFQSQFYNVIAFLILLAIIFLTDRDKLGRKTFWGLIFLMWLNLLTIIISQSRSFWVGLIISVLVFFAYLIYLKSGWRKLLTYVLAFPIMIAISLLIINITIGNLSMNLFGNRLGGGEGSESAVSSRGAQLGPLLTEIKQKPVLGYGFGKTITFQSSDPRIKTAQNPQGWRTTYSFELAYLDIVLKIGILGLAIYLLLLFYIFKGYFVDKKIPWKVGLILGFIALLAINMFTPYLNHPLGIGYILIMIGLIQYRSDETAISSDKLPS